MNKKVSKIAIGASIVAVLLIAASLKGCRAYDTPEIKTIEPSQTAFLIPLIGQTSKQANFMSEEFLEKNKIATKEIQIPHRWLKTGRSFIVDNGKWIPSAKLIVVERKPVTRQWTEDNTTGTSEKNEGITAESRESIGFMVRMNCSAQIDEADAVKFLYRYNNKSLNDVMDTEIRARIESKFVEECSKLNLDQILLSKEKIMENVRSYTIPYFKERGITITVIGLKGELSYLNPEIQKSIDEKFKSSQSLITQKNLNEQAISKAKADAEAVKIQASTIGQQIQLKKLENQSKALDNQAKAIEKWDGKAPEVQGGNGMIFNIPAK